MFWLKMMNFLDDVTMGEGDTSKLQEVWDGVNKVVDQLMPFVYAALGLFLVVKGAILGMQIVKAADEPQVRQEKIGSLKWLAIGVAIAFGVAILADVLIGYFAGIAGETVAEETAKLFF